MLCDNVNHCEDGSDEAIGTLCEGKFFFLLISSYYYAFIAIICWVRRLYFFSFSFHLSSLFSYLTFITGEQGSEDVLENLWWCLDLFLFAFFLILVLPVSFIFIIIALCALNEFFEHLWHIIVFSAYQWYRFWYDIGVDCCDNNLFVINDGSVRSRHRYLYLSTKYKSKYNNERKPDDYYYNIERCQWSETFKLLSPCSIRWVMNDSIKFKQQWFIICHDDGFSAVIFYEYKA